MRILVDHSGYALLNIGDIAMLQACVRRLQKLWPDADIEVLTESPQRLEQHCPGVSAVAPTIVGRRGASVLPMSGQLAAEQIWKTIMPLLTRFDRRLTGTGATSVRPGLLDAIRRADVVVSSGGGFVNDVFWWHGAGVLSVLAMAQRLGTPTAMFGQGIGPLTHPLLSRLVRRTMPRLEVIGLREGIESVLLLEAHGVGPDCFDVTGDDALLLATRPTRPHTGTAIGLNVRVASYSGIELQVASQVAAIAREAAARRGVSTAALPVSRYARDSDLDAIRPRDTDLPPDNGAEHEFVDIQTPEELTERVARCRVVVTGSYHAAVFALAAGIPVVCITNSRYYDGKFLGLAAQFPGGCHVLCPGPGFAPELRWAIDRAWDTGDASRDYIHSAAMAQVARADALYGRFKSLVVTGATWSNHSGIGNGIRIGAAVLREGEPLFEDQL